MTGLFDDHGITFQYPTNWELDVNEAGAVTTVAINAPKANASRFEVNEAEVNDASPVQENKLRRNSGLASKSPIQTRQRARGEQNQTTSGHSQ